MTIRGDSQEYELLKKWTETLPFYEVPKFGTTVEIGVREGLGSKLIMLAIRGRLGGAKVPYKHIGIDPYGNLKYQHCDGTKESTSDYTDKMKDQMIKDLEDHPEFTFYHMKDIEFMNEFAETGFQVYDLVHFDGPHMTKDVLREAIWFADRSRIGTRFIFDDSPRYSIKDITSALLYWNFDVHEEGSNRVCLQRFK